MHASISHDRRSRGYPSPWWAWPVTPLLWHWIRTQSPASEPGRSLSSTPCRPLSDVSGTVTPVSFSSTTRTTRRSGSGHQDQRCQRQRLGLSSLAFSRRKARRRRRAFAAASASSRRYWRKCSGCAAIHTSGRSNSRSTWSDDMAISKARTYANGSIQLYALRV